MGWIRHHGIVVTSWDSAALARAHTVAIGMFPDGHVTEPTKKALNGYSSFLVAPDGSKEGWGDSDDGDARREQFVEWLNGAAYEDGSSALAWIEYQHDQDNRSAGVLRFTGSANDGGTERG
jgi:hypothetical protein